jgi:hypothetical protein
MEQSAVGRPGTSHRADGDGESRSSTRCRSTAPGVDVDHREPKVPFRALPRRAFQAVRRFDVVCLARSPSCSPAESDPLFDEIRERFIDETPFS